MYIYRLLRQTKLNQRSLTTNYLSPSSIVSLVNCSSLLSPCHPPPSSNNFLPSFPSHPLTASARCSITTSSSTALNNSPSRKDLLNQIPHSKYKPILNHIERIGVGIRTRKGKPFHKKKKTSAFRDNYDAARDGDFLSPHEEASFFAQQRRNRKQAAANKKLKRRPQSNQSDGKRFQVWEKHKSDDSHKKGTNSQSNVKDDGWWIPPPPFSASTDVYFWENNHELGYQIKRLPVKILGSSNTTTSTVTETTTDLANPEASRELPLGEKDAIPPSKSKSSALDHPIHTFDFPRSSKSLPEIALVGRSNVGKSTLLNALLYGNIRKHDYDPHRQKGKTFENSKLPKGVKAVMSSKPGETKDITFYQLSSEIRFPSTSNNSLVDDEANMNSSSSLTSKMSLVLADLPGYGFAYASEEKLLEYKQLMTEYLLHRGSSLKRVLLLLDARHGIKHTDVEFLLHLQSSLKSRAQPTTISISKKRQEIPPIQIVLTKCDLVPQIELAKRVIQVREELSNIWIREPSSLPIMLVSAKPGVGFNNVRTHSQTVMGGVLELQRELAALVPEPKRPLL